MRIAIVGCGYVADFYLSTMPNHPELELVGVMDRDVPRARKFARFWKVPQVYETLQSLLEDPRVDIVVNLTNPASHYEVSRAALLAGKHVYVEKPLTLSMDHARALVALAAERGLYLSGAPCNVLGEAAQTTWRALREGVPGRVRAVFAELNEGMLHLTNFREWASTTGMPWPYEDEFEMGVAIEHAGYYVTWLVAFFGRARSVTVFNACQVPEKAPEVAPERQGPDFSVACIEFESGVVARLTCSLVARHDHWIRIYGEKGTLSCQDGWMYGAPVHFEPFEWGTSRLARLMLRNTFSARLWMRYARRVPPARRASFVSYTPNVHHMDYSRGVAELAAAVREQRACRLSAEFLLHVNEIVLALRYGSGRVPITTPAGPPMAPMPWALTAAEAQAAAQGRAA